MRQSFRAVLAILAVTGILSGCNTMLKDSFQRLEVNTPGVENVDCTLTTDVNKYHMMAPGIVNVERASDTLTVVCEKAGYAPAVVVVERKIRAAGVQLNTFNGFLAAPYDVLSRSIYEYPSPVTVKMIPDMSEVVPLVPREVHTMQLKRSPPKPKPVEDKKAVEKAVSTGAKK